MNTPQVRAQHRFQLAECGMGPDLSPVVSGRSDSQVLGVTQGQRVTRKRGVMVHLLPQLCPYLTHIEHSLIEHPVFLISSPMSASKSCSPQIITVVLLERHYIEERRYNKQFDSQGIYILTSALALTAPTPLFCAHNKQPQTNGDKSGMGLKYRRCTIAIENTPYPRYGGSKMCFLVSWAQDGWMVGFGPSG